MPEKCLKCQYNAIMRLMICEDCMAGKIKHTRL